MYGAGGGKFEILTIAASAGGVKALLQLVSSLPSDISVPVVVVQHLPFRSDTVLREILAGRTRLQVKWAEDSDRLRSGVIYVAPPRSRVTLRSRWQLQVDPAVKNHLGTPAADPLFEAIAEVFGDRAMAVILTGCLWDGAVGTQALKDSGATILIQDPLTALAAGMPQAAIATTGLHFVFPLNRMAPAIAALLDVPDVMPLLIQANLPLRHWLQYTDNTDAITAVPLEIPG